MKKFLTFCIIAMAMCLWSRAQFNFTDQAFLGQAGTVSGGEFNWAQFANLYIQLMGNATTNWTGGTNNNPPSTWIDMTGLGGRDFTNGITDQGGSKPPVYSPNGPNGYYAADYRNNASSGVNVECLLCQLDMETNQPSTIFIVATDTAASGAHTLMDCRAGGRNLFQISTVNGSGSSYAGVGYTFPPVANSGNWFIYSMVYTNGNSFTRTNGVKYATGNPGTQKMGKTMLGDDTSGVTPYIGKIAAVLAYGQLMSTNDIITVERALNTKYNLGYTIPGP